MLTKEEADKIDRIKKNIKKYYKFDAVMERGNEQMRKLDEAFEEIAQRKKNAAV